MLYCTLPELTGVDVEEGALVKNGSGGQLGTGVRMADVDPKKAGGGGQTLRQGPQKEEGHWEDEGMDIAQEGHVAE